MSDELMNVLGIDIGGKIAVCIADSQGKSGQSASSQRHCAYEQVLPQIIGQARQLMVETGLTNSIAACGICAPLDMVGGRIMKSPNMAWDAVPIRDDRPKPSNCPSIWTMTPTPASSPKFFFGCAKGKKDVIYLTMSTGVGGGIIANGRLVTGASGIGGELGHLVLDVNGPICGCGQLGCLEAYCGGRNIALRLQDALRYRQDHALMRLPEVDGKLENLNFQTVREGAKLGIPLAVAMWDEICMRLAQGIGICMATFNPEMIILGTAAYYAGDFMLQPVLATCRNRLEEFRSACEVCITVLG